MTGRKSTAARSPKGGRAARAETADNPEPKKFEFRGVDLVGPADLQGEGVFFAFTDFAAHAEEGISYIAAHRLLENVIGRPQLLQLEGQLKGPDDYMELLTALLELYGFELGEA